jgi:hypothetical protein
MKFSSLGGVEATARVVAVGRDCRWGPYAPRRRGVRIGCSRSHGECRLPSQCSTPCELPNLGAVIADPWLTLLPWLRVPERLSRGQVDGSFATDRVIHLRVSERGRIIPRDDPAANPRHLLIAVRGDE